jgi:DNA-binding transcriptional regulator YiaG
MRWKAGSQAVFAKLLGVSLNTVRAWEQGVNHPSDMACRFLDEIRRDPAYWVRRLKEAVIAR